MFLNNDDFCNTLALQISSLLVGIKGYVVVRL